MTAFPNFPDLAAYLLVYMARADGQVHYLEDASLKEEMKHFTDQPGAVLKHADEVYVAEPGVSIDDIFSANNQLVESISYDTRMELIRSLYAIINSDGRVHEDEMAALRKIRAGLETSDGHPGGMVATEYI